MSGKRLANTREGDRSETLAEHFLSSIAFVTRIGRPEDFGVVDLLCVLNAKKDKCVYPEWPFFVQVKSFCKRVILDRDQCSWILNHMRLPLFIAVVNKKEGRVELFCCSNMWTLLFELSNRTLPSRMEITLYTELPLGVFRSVGGDGGGAYEVPIGPPILNATLTEMEQSPEKYGRLLGSWIKRANFNLSHNFMGRVCSRVPIEWQTNGGPRVERRQYHYEAHYNEAEGAIVPILTGLAHNYNHRGDVEALESLEPLLELYEHLLDDHGKWFAAGRSTEETEPEGTAAL